MLSFFFQKKNKLSTNDLKQGDETYSISALRIDKISNSHIKKIDLIPT